MNLRIVTRCTRPQNLLKISESIPTHLKWVILIDTQSLKEISTSILENLERPNVEVKFCQGLPGDWGHDLLNREIDSLLPDEWIYFLDDDTVLHPEFFKISDLQPTQKGIIFSQDYNGWIRSSSPENVKVTKIDMGQFVLQKELIGNYRFAPHTYFADGLFIESIYNQHSGDFLIINEVYSYYNKLRTIDDWYLPRILKVGIETQLTSVPYQYEETRIAQRNVSADEAYASICEWKPDLIVSSSQEALDKLSNIPDPSFKLKWIHMVEDENLGPIAHAVLSHSILANKKPLFSVITPTRNCKELLYRTWKSVKEQTEQDWEWVIVDDSDDGGKTWDVVKSLGRLDSRISTYRISPSSGSIGEAKRRAFHLGKGQYLLELDHDDLLCPWALEATKKAFDQFPDSKFVYSDCMEVDQNFDPLTYGDTYAFGYGKYYDFPYMGKTLKAAYSPDINPKTIRHIVGVPNHLRCWERNFYLTIGGHNSNLRIADDYELIVRSFLETTFVHIAHPCYVQVHDGRNSQNSSRDEIQRRVRTIAQFYNTRTIRLFEQKTEQDWAYDSSPGDPLLAPSRFGELERPVNHILKLS